MRGPRHQGAAAGGRRGLLGRLVPPLLLLAAQLLVACAHKVPIVFESAPITYEDTANSNAARFIVANGQAVTVAANQTVQLQFVLQFASTSGGQNVGATIGRGTTSGVDTSYINLANGVAFSSTDLMIMNTIATVGNLDTGLSQTWYPSANEAATVHLNALDQPGAGTHYYAVRVRCILSSRFYVRNSYFIIKIFDGI